jgi:hypothetical protein
LHQPAEGGPSFRKPHEVRRRLVAVWLGAHLLLCALFALCPHTEGFWHYLPPGILTPVRLYGAFTGATGSYGFFSPNVAPQLPKMNRRTRIATRRHVKRWAKKNATRLIFAAR